MNRYKITLEYLGAGYCGWQRQKESLSLQQVVEEAIFAFSRERVNITVAGRTDSGVNAYGQVAHFDLEKYYDPARLSQSINHFVRPHTIGVVDSEIVDEDFNARFSAKSRSYIYKILNRTSVNVVNRGLQHWVRHDLDIKQMQIAANYLLGKHDFSSFRSSDCQSNSPVRTLDEIKITKIGENIEIYVSARSFLHHMIRNIAGSLIVVGTGKWKPEKIKEVLEFKDRRRAGPMAPADGLYFLKVEY